MNMNAVVKHIPSGAVYENRKEAKTMMGHSNYNKELLWALSFFLLYALCFCFFFIVSRGFIF